MQEIQYIGENLWIGQLCKSAIYIAFLSAILSSISYFISIRKSNTPDETSWLTLGKISFYIHGISIIALLSTMFYAMVSHQYEYSYVFDHVSEDLPMKYILSAFWEGQEGSFLLWMFWHIVIGIILIRTSGKFQAPVIMIIALAEVWLNSMILGIYPNIFGEYYKLGSNPMTLIRDMNPAPIFNNADYLSLIKGRGLNPLLQNYWMTIHPPFVFFGFALSIVPFAFAFAALVKKEFHDWLRPALKWTLLTASILGVAILMGSLWAYEALSFGGYWAWDPVENTSLVPWIFLVAGIHTNLIANATGRAIRSTLVFYLLGFLMVLYSTFLTRSGILGDTSAHAFTEMGLEWQLAFFIFFFLILGFGFLIYHYKKIPTQEKEEAVQSKEFWMYIGTLVLLLSGVLINASSSLPVFNSIASYFDKGYVGRVIQNPIEHYNKYQLWIAVFVAFLSGISIWFQYRTITSLKKKVFISFGLHAAIAIILTVLTTLWIVLPQWFHYVMAFTMWFTISSNIEFLIRGFKHNAVSISSAIAHVGFGLMGIGILSTGLNHKYLSDPFIFKGLFADEGGEEKYVQLIKEKPLLIKDYLITYTSDTLIGNTRLYDLSFKKLDKDLKVIDSFVTRPNAVYANDFSKIAAYNPDTRHYFHEDIFTCVVQLPPAIADSEQAKIIEDSTKYTSYNVALGDTITLEDTKVIVDKINFEPSHPEYKKFKHDIGYELEYSVINDGKHSKGITAIGLNGNIVYKYPGVENALGLKLRPSETIIDRFLTPEENLKYSTITFNEGETLEYNGMKIKLSGFDRNIDSVRYTAEPDDIAIAGIVEVSNGGEQYKAKPIYVIRGNAPMSIKDYIPELGLHIRLSKIEPLTKKFELKLAQDTRNGDSKIPIDIASNVPRTDYLILEAKIFPGINLFWLGSLMMMIGLLVAWIFKFKSKSA